MSDHPIASLGKRIGGTAKEVVAEITGDARLQEDGRRDIADGRSPAVDGRPDLRASPRPTQEGIRR
ncbi:CsbD family protein [Aureimonas sp. AU40]|uniref:CsbD family protein n=1 Tax=Aureimonas sp. AU40 TaxID=1637747 RepID=UPI000782346D|nr:CsbD family protein [Aureimonas sp. AU40]